MCTIFLYNTVFQGAKQQKHVKVAMGPTGFAFIFLKRILSYTVTGMTAGSSWGIELETNVFDRRRSQRSTFKKMAVVLLSPSSIKDVSIKFNSPRRSCSNTGYNLIHDLHLRPLLHMLNVFILGCLHKLVFHTGHGKSKINNKK